MKTHISLDAWELVKDIYKQKLKKRCWSCTSCYHDINTDLSNLGVLFIVGPLQVFVTNLKPKLKIGFLGKSMHKQIYNMSFNSGLFLLFY